jgi:hypothetical protein
MGVVTIVQNNDRQKVTVFQQQGSGERKIAGVRLYGNDIIDLDVVSIDVELPPVVDDSSQFLPRELETDLVLDFLKHSDLSQDLADFCAEKGIPVIASGKKIDNKWVMKPPT